MDVQPYQPAATKPLSLSFKLQSLLVCIEIRFRSSPQAASSSVRYSERANSRIHQPHHKKMSNVRLRRRSRSLYNNAFLAPMVIGNIILCLNNSILPISGFVLPIPDVQTLSTKSTTKLDAIIDPQHLHQMIMTTTSSSSSTLLSSQPSLIVASDNEAAWRQYVPLAVSSFVILDILLGSPFVNLILQPLRDATIDSSVPKQKQKNDDGDKGTTSDSPKSPLSFLLGRTSDGNTSSSAAAKNSVAKKKERIDTDRVAQEAIARAQNALEFRTYLDSRKSDFDKIEDIKRNLDQDMKTLDKELEAKQRAFESRNDP
jgi:hypothetical protein